MTADVTYSRIPEDAAERWAIVRAVIAGDQALKAAKLLPYLNAADKSAENIARNAAYVERAVYFNATGRTLDGLMGIAYRQDPRHDIPAHLDYLLTDADGSGNSIYQQSQSVAAQVLAVGRHGLLVDYDAQGAPTIKSYAAESIINWRHDDGLVLLVLLESAEEPDGYGLTMETQYRELALVNGVCVCRLWRLDKEGKPYIHQSRDANTGAEADEIVIRSRAKPLDFIPFCFVGSRNNDSTVDDSPLYPLAKLNIAHYRNSADYEDSVFYVGQAQPWVSGLTEEWRDHMESKATYIGSRSPLLLPEGGAFGFAQPSPNTLVFEAMEQKEKQMVALGARLLDDHAARMTATQSDNDRETSTSVLSSCMANVSEAYQTAIGWCALMLDRPMSSAEIQAAYKINQDYGRAVIDSQAIAALVAAWQAGVIGKVDLRAYLRAEGILTTERTDEDIDGDLDAQGPSLGVIGAV